MGNTLSSTLHLTLGLLYPLYCSFRSLEPPPVDGEKVDESHQYVDRQWLAYFIVYSFVRLGNHFLDPFIKLIPMNSVWKLLLLVWLQSPRTKGALMLYTYYIGPWMRNNRHSMEYLGALMAAKLAEAGAALSGMLLQRINIALSAMRERQLPSTDQVMEGAASLLVDMHQRLQTAAEKHKEAAKEAANLSGHFKQDDDKIVIEGDEGIIEDDNGNITPPPKYDNSWSIMSHLTAFTIRRGG